MPPLSLGNGFKAENLEVLCLPLCLYLLVHLYYPRPSKPGSECWICTKILSVGKENGSIWIWISLTDSCFVVASFPLPEREIEDLHRSKADGRSKKYWIISMQWNVDVPMKCRATGLLISLNSWWYFCSFSISHIQTDKQLWFSLHAGKWNELSPNQVGISECTVVFFLQNLYLLWPFCLLSDKLNIISKIIYQGCKTVKYTNKSLSFEFLLKFSYSKVLSFSKL